MKRTPLRRRSPLRARQRAKTRRRTRYAKRERFVDYMLWVKTLPCYVRQFFAVGVTACTGVVEADHAGRRGVGQKAHDGTCIPLCTGHHRERHDFSGTFAAFVQAEMRVFLATAIAVTQAKAREAGIEVPPVSVVVHAVDLGGEG